MKESPGFPRWFHICLSNKESKYTSANLILVPGGSSLGGVLNGGVLVPEKHDGTHDPPNDDFKYELRKMSTYILADRERQRVCV